VYDGHFTLAKENGKLLHEVMGWRGSMTHRQFMAWAEWKDEQWNTMEKMDYYLAQISAVIHRANQGKKRKKIKITDYKIEFKKAGAKAPRESIATTKARWIGRLGGKENIEHRLVSPPEESRE
jgi:hypothetical protein